MKKNRALSLLAASMVVGMMSVDIAKACKIRDIVKVNGYHSIFGHDNDELNVGMPTYYNLLTENVPIFCTFECNRRANCNAFYYVYAPAGAPNHQVCIYKRSQGSQKTAKPYEHGILYFKD